MANVDTYLSASMQLNDLSAARIAQIQADYTSQFVTGNANPASPNPVVYVMVQVGSVPKGTAPDDHNYTIGTNVYAYTGSKGKPPGSDSL